MIDTPDKNNRSPLAANDAECLLLSNKARDLLMANPPAPNEALIRAAKNWKTETER